MFPTSGSPQLEGLGDFDLLPFALSLARLAFRQLHRCLRWRRLAFHVLLQRLLITATVTLMMVAIARWLVNPGPGGVAG